MLEAGTHSKVIVGIPFGSTASWRVVADDGSFAEGEPITTAAWPPPLPHPSLLVDEPAQQLPGGKYLLTSINQKDSGWTGGTYWIVILDRQGRLIWARRALNNAWTLFAQVAVTGAHLLVDENAAWSDFDAAGSLVRRTYLDEEIEVIDTPGMHHAFVQLPDQTLAWGSLAHGGTEALVEKAVGQLDETVVWTCLDDSNFGNCMSNGLFFNPATNTYLYSFFTNSTVTEVDRTTGQSLWWAGIANGGLAFIPAESQYFWHHGVSYTDAGTLLVSSEFGDPRATWALEYEVDQTLGTLTLVWMSDSAIFAETNGQAWRLENGNTLHIVGSASVIREVAPTGGDVWRLAYGSDYLLGQGQFLSDLYALVKPE